MARCLYGGSLLDTIERCSEGTAVAYILPLQDLPFYDVLQRSGVVKMEK